MKNSNADGLRGLAAFSVCITHFIAAFLPWMLHYNYTHVFAPLEHPGPVSAVFSSPFATLFYNGQFPVFIFFVMSGYVLTLPYFQQTDAVPVLQRRLWARYLRLNLPIIVAVALAWLAYKSGSIHSATAAEISGSKVWLASFYPEGMRDLDALKEAAFGSIVLGEATFLPPLWTLKVEFVGSLYILLFYLAKPARLTWIPLLLVSLLLYIIHGSDSIYYLAIFAGSTLHRLRIERQAQIVLAAVGAYFGAFQYMRTMYDFLPDPRIWDIKNFYNAIGAVCLCASVLSGFGHRLFTKPAVQFLGRISFSLYLLHFIVLSSLATSLYVHFPREPLYLFVCFASYLSVCVLSAWVFERWVDRPAISISRRFSACLYPREVDAKVLR